MVAPLSQDLPDDYPWLPGSTRYPVGDLGEIAARLGSPLVYDRRGEVIWIDDFRYGIKGWNFLGSGAGSGGFLVADPRLMGPYSAELIAGSSLSHYAQLIKNFSAQSLGRCGIEVAMEFASDFETMLVLLTRSNNGITTQGAIEFNFTDEALKYLGDDGLYHDFATLASPPVLANKFQFIKLVVDLDTSFYVRAMHEETEYDLAGISLYTVAGSGLEYQAALLRLTGRAGNNDTMHLGHVILTGNDQ